MNLLFTAVADFLTLDAQAYLTAWRARFHIVEQMPFEHVAAYLKLDPASALALVDAIVCMADADLLAIHKQVESPAFDNPLGHALELAANVHGLPESCTMSDGRKWRTIPFIIFSATSYYGAALSEQTHARIYSVKEPLVALNEIRHTVDEYHDRVLAEYENLGMLIRFEKGRAQIGPAMKLRSDRMEGDYYYGRGDRRNNRGWVTIKRDNEGRRQDVALFEMLLERGADETEMQRFFEEHPAILMEARLGIPIAHSPNFARPKNNRPDFAFTPILGLWADKIIEFVELKGPTEKILTQGFHPGFSAKVHHAVDQVRDYEQYSRDPFNLPVTTKSFGYIPDSSRLAVLIGRAPENHTERDVWIQRQSGLDVEVVTYDEILKRQADQIEGPYTLRYGTPEFPL